MLRVQKIPRLFICERTVPPVCVQKCLHHKRGQTKTLTWVDIEKFCIASQIIFNKIAVQLSDFQMSTVLFGLSFEVFTRRAALCTFFFR